MSFHWRCKVREIVSVGPSLGYCSPSGKRFTYALVPAVPDLVGGDVEGTVLTLHGQCSVSRCIACLTCSETGCNPQLKSEGAGKSSGQENSVLADEGPKHREECLG